MRISEAVQPRPEVINSIKTSYNRALERFRSAQSYLDNPGIAVEDKEPYIIPFKVEVADVMETYLQVLKDWGIEAAPDEIINGFIIKT